MRSNLVSRAALTLVLGIASPVFAQLPGPTLVTPEGLAESSAHTFSWRALAGATWYQIWIEDSVRAPRLAEWYTAAQAGCSEGTGICAVHLAVDLADGRATWWVRGYNASGNGLWSLPLALHIRRVAGAWTTLPAELRFQLVLSGNAVLDRETGLVWERVPPAATFANEVSPSVCALKAIGGRRGWRVPTQPELASLVVEGHSPALPTGHPFTVGTGAFWAQTPYGTNYWNIAFDPSFTIGLFNGTSALARVWCVRGATGADR